MVYYLQHEILECVHMRIYNGMVWCGRRSVCLRVNFDPCCPLVFVVFSSTINFDSYLLDHRIVVFAIFFAIKSMLLKNLDEKIFTSRVVLRKIFQHHKWMSSSPICAWSNMYNHHICCRKLKSLLNFLRSLYVTAGLSLFYRPLSLILHSLLLVI